MKIGINALFIRPGVNGGTETYTREMVKQFGAICTKDEFVLYGTDSQLADWCREYRNCEFREVGMQWKNVPYRIAYEQTAFAGKLRQDGIDVLFSPGYVTPLLGTFPTVTTIHDMFAYVYPQYLHRARVLYWRTMLPLSMRRSARVIAVSENTAADIRKYLPEFGDKVRVVREAAEDRFCPPDSQSRKPAGAPKVPYLLGVSTIQPFKNVPNLIRGYARARKDHGVMWDLVLIGRDAMGNVKSLAKELRISEHVHLTGYVETDELIRYYQCAEAFVSASVYEGFGLPVLEAMACGCPVVCARTSIFTEIAGDSALMFDPFDVAEIAERIAQLWRDPAEREELRRRGLAKAAEYSWARAATELHGIFHEVAGMAPEPAASVSSKG